MTSRNATILLRRAPGFVERGIVVVAGGIGLIRRRIGGIRAVPKPEARAAVKHVEVYRAVVLEHPFQVAHLVLAIGAVMRLRPMVEPARPILAADQRSVRTQRAQHPKVALGIAGSEGCGDGNARQRAAFEIPRLVDRVVRRRVEPRLVERVAQRFEIRLAVAECAVFVFELHGQDRAAARTLQRREFLAQAFEPTPHRAHVRFILRPQCDRFAGEQPRRKTAEIPFGADVRSRPQNDGQAGSRSGPHELRDVVLAGKIVRTRRGLVKIPEDVRRDRVEAHSVGHLQARLPVGARNSRIVHLTGEERRVGDHASRRRAAACSAVRSRCGCAEQFVADHILAHRRRT